MLWCRFVQTAAAVTLAGVGTLRLLAWGTGLAGSRAWTRLASGCWGTLAVASVVQLGLTAAAMSGLPLARAMSGGVLGQVLGGTSYGAAWQVRIGLLAGWLPVFWLASGDGSRRPGREWVTGGLNVVGVLLSAALLASLVWNGHAGASASRAWLLPVDLAHAVAAGAWPGGLLPLALLLARVGYDPGLVPAAVTVTRRFSRLSVGAVLVLASSGLLNGYGLIGSTPAAWTAGSYRRLACCKIVLLAAMVLLGAVNRRLIRPGGPGEEPPGIRRLWRNVAWECGLAVVVLLASAALAVTAPPSETR